MQDTFHWIKKIKESPSKFYTERFILQSSAISVQINYNKYYNATHQDSQNNDDANKAKEYLEEASVKVRKMGRSYKYDANDLSTLEENFQKTKELLEKLMASHSKR
ncbi:hypothetical protein BCO_0900057 (plasmid) [Borrelia coriaceae ATCC 43381]|uniref:Uncharacterized protein n=3 Tax=Borrelia coriaceae TaxID=144 RepID=W5SWB8_9SPIR|nr:hypothetical protein [Borrelia coriaceae]AHH11225.1 hypothetical protein BCO_0900057 [Borrelia coriaceae ATCC 43381]